MIGATSIHCDTQQGTLEIVFEKPPSVYGTLQEFVHDSISKSLNPEEDFVESEYYNAYQAPGGFTHFGGFAGAACSVHFANGRNSKGIVYMEDLDGNQSLIDGPVVSVLGGDEINSVDELRGGLRAQELEGGMLRIDESHPHLLGQRYGDSLHFVQGDVRTANGEAWKGISTKTSDYLAADPPVPSRRGEFRTTVVYVD
jgi:hypothetical protein